MNHRRSPLHAALSHAALHPAAIEAWVAACAAGAPAAALIAPCLEQAQRHNPRTRIYTTFLDDHCRERAAALDAAITRRKRRSGSGPRLPPLWGIPVAIKDNIDIRGAPTSCGSIALARRDVSRDARIVGRLQGLGAVLLGKTNLDEAALGASGRNPHFGRCHNPCGEELLSGGSSSGSAAAVAMGQALLAIGTDTLGSVRIPAALCGVVGFKPSRGRLRLEGVEPLYPPFDTLGLLTASLRDVRTACIALGIGGNWGSGSGSGMPPRILVLRDSALAAVDADVADHYRRCRDVLCNTPRVSVREFPTFEFESLARAALWEVASDFARRIGFRTAAFAARRALLGPDLLQLLERACTLPAARLDQGSSALRAAGRSIRDCMADADALLTPTCCTRAIRAAATVPKSLPAFVAPANIAGLPALSWPQALTGGATGSLQLIGRARRDLALIDLALHLQSLLESAVAVAQASVIGASGQ